jgi:hypothetical protein
MWLERDLIHEFDRQRLAKETHSARLVRQAGITGPSLQDRLLHNIGEALIVTGTRLKKMSEASIEPEYHRPLAKNAT